MLIDKHLLEDYMESEMTGKLHRITNKVIDKENKIQELLNDEQKKVFMDYVDSADYLHCEEIDHALKYGFNYAVVLIKEFLGAKF